MKKIYIVILTLTLAACGDKLDIKPQISIDESIALDSDQNVKRALLGAYDGLSGFNGPLLASAGNVWGGDFFLYAELLASDGEISWVGTFPQGREISGKNILVNNTWVRNQWTGSYYTINICNHILANITNVNDEDRDRVKGEALFIRGSIYHELVRFYAQPYSAGNTTSNPGVPLVLTPTPGISEESLVSRSSVEQVYQQILADLTEAESLLPEENEIYATKGAAAGILSRVYLAMGNYAGARDAADRVIGSDLYELTATYAAAFNNSTNSVEDIFATQVNEQDGDNNLQLYWSTPDDGARDGDVQIEDKHLNLYEDGDDRKELFYVGNGAVRSGKWKLQFKNVNVIRLAEMYLTRAEGNFRLGTEIGDSPLNDINLIRERVSLDPLDDATLTLDAILKERKLELAHEGHAIHDRRRLQQGTDGLPYNALKLVFPIPVREINANKNLKQNDGYGAN